MGGGGHTPYVRGATMMKALAILALGAMGTGCDTGAPVNRYVEDVHVVDSSTEWFNADAGDLVIDLELRGQECLDAGGVPTTHACIGVDF
jgi:hypothetical protein